MAASIAGLTACGSRFQSSALPGSLTDAEFWDLTTRLSEPGGAFDSDNLVSNEIHFVHAARLLRPRGGAYIGVGPEQNFTYIARLRPAVAFIVDIRQENRNLHLMYKALFELSADRADFLSRLFSRERPAAIGRGVSVQSLFAAFETARPASSLFEASSRSIRERLTGAHRFPLMPDDFTWMDHALKSFSVEGPQIRYRGSYPSDVQRPSYHDLMTAQDTSGRTQSFLATDDAFAFLKDLHARNMIVPLVGDFAGPRAIQGVGEYLRRHRAALQGFYGSNVEVYLNRQQRHAFCRNLAGLPHAPGTWFIGSKGMQPFRAKLSACAATSQ